MTKQEIIKVISQQSNLKPEEVKKVLDTFFDVIKEGLKKGEGFYFRNFGQFMIKRRKEKVGRDFNNNRSIVIPAYDLPFFKASKAFFDS